MKRLALAISVLAVTATGALSNPVYNWTGFYLGGNVGYSWGRSASTLGSPMRGQPSVR
jgi:outer membrane immunogenic protein